MRFPTPRPCGSIEALAKAGAVEELFDLFDGFLKDKGYLAMGGQIIDATIVSAPKQHNSREENETIKEGETPEAIEEIRWIKSSTGEWKCRALGFEKFFELDAGESFAGRARLRLYDCI
jgi:hypothetical protein